MTVANIVWNFNVGTDLFFDVAHEGPSFPTWHRLYLLWIEREIQIIIKDHRFRVPYWDWRIPTQRDVPFHRDRLGESIDGEVVGDLFDGGDWKLKCWEDIGEKPFPLPICNPNVASSEKLQRCPNETLCNKSNEKWPSHDEVAEAILIDMYDTSPYNRFVTDTDYSYRNLMEGFVITPGSDCGDDTMCTVDDRMGVTISRRNHNTVSLLLYSCYVYTTHLLCVI